MFKNGQHRKQDDYELLHMSNLFISLWGGEKSIIPVDFFIIYKHKIYWVQQKRFQQKRFQQKKDGNV